MMTKVVGRIGDLPAIPDVVAEVMEMTSDPGVAVSDVSKAIERDPALAAKLLRVSNSSYYGMRQVVGTLKLALVILGVREVRNIVLGISVLDTLRDSETEILLSHHGLWAHSTLVAGTAKHLAVAMELRMQGEDFIAGLLHDIGKLVMWRHLGEDYRELYVEAGKIGRSLCEAEQAAYGFDHADVGAALAGAWSLPNSLTCALQYHHAGPGRDLSSCPSPRLAALVRIANLAAHDDWESAEEDLASCTSDAWDILEDGDVSYSLAERRDWLVGVVQRLEESPSLAF